MNIYGRGYWPSGPVGKPGYVYLAVWFFLMALIAINTWGCSTTPILPGHDPFVVTAERELNASLDAYKAVTEFDNKFRTWMRANAPTVHAGVETLRRTFWPVYDTTTAAVRTYKRSKLEHDGQVVNDNLEELRNLVKQARDLLLEAQTIRSTPTTQPFPDMPPA